MPIDIKTNLPTSYDSQTDTADDGTNTSGVLPQSALVPPTLGTSTPTADASSAISGITHAKTDRLSASNVGSVAASGLGMSPSERQLPVSTAFGASGRMTPQAKEIRANASATVNSVISLGQGSAGKAIIGAQEIFAAPSSGSTQSYSYGSVGDINTQAMNILQRAGFESEKTDMTMNNAANKNVMDQQKQQAEVLKAQVQGEKKSAVFKLVGSLAGAGVGLGAGIRGQQLRDSGNSKTNTEVKDNVQKSPVVSAQSNSSSRALSLTSAAPASPLNRSSLLPAQTKTDGTMAPSVNHAADVKIAENKTADAHAKASQTSNTNSSTPATTAADPMGGIFSKKNDAARGAAYDSAGQSLAQVPGSVVDLVDKVYGGAHEADQAKIQNKQLDASITGSKSVQDNTKSAKDKSIKMVDDAFATLKAHYDLEKSTNDNIANK